MNPSVAYDARDQEVLLELDRLDIEVVDVPRLEQIYERVTDVKQRKTMRRRIRSLTSTEDFERVGFQRWRWSGRVPGDGES